MNNIIKDNYYQVLNIPENASPCEIEKAYELVWETFEADMLENYSKKSDADCDAIMQRISCAYMTLIDPITRIRYDQSLHSLSSTPLVEKVTLEKNQTSAKNYYFIPDFCREGTKTSKETPQNSSQESPPPFVEQTRVKPAEVARSSEKAADDSPRETQTIPPIPPPPPNSRHKAFGELMDNHLVGRHHNRKVIERKNSDSRQKMADFMSTVESFNGKLLQQVRQLKSIKLEEVAQETCVQFVYLEAIENEEYSKLPRGLVYVKNYIRAYAQCLELPVQKVMEDCLKFYEVWQQRFSGS